MSETATVDKAAIMTVLGRVMDPEIPVISIVDLGIVRGVADSPPRVLISPTYTGCPATVAIEQAIHQALKDAGFGGVFVERVMFPPWTTEWISERGRQQLHDYGIAPPSDSKSATCPRCGSADTTEISRFGATPCKAQWRCNACLEPFERFKCH